MDYKQEIKKLNNNELLFKLNSLVIEERKMTLAVLHYLHEVESRRLFAEMGYGSLHEFCTKFLKYSEGAAHRRISSMRLLKEVPEAGLALTQGTLTLTSVSKVQNFLNAEKREQKKVYSKAEKLELVKQVERKSTKECEKILASISSQSTPKDTVRIISANASQIHFTASNELIDKLNKIKNLVSHKMINPSYDKLFQLLADIALEKLDPMTQQRKRTKGKEENKAENFKLKNKISSSTIKSEDTTLIAKNNTNIFNAKKRADVFEAENKIELLNKTKTNDNIIKKNKDTRYIPQAIKLAVWNRDQGKCSYFDPITKQKCNSAFQLQYDHKTPFAMHGQATIKNIRLLCAQHNRLVAIQKFGEEKMSAYLKI